MTSGKTITSEYLVSEYGYMRIGFAEPIYNIVDNLEILSPEILYSKYLEPYIEPSLSFNEKVTFIKAIRYAKTIPNETPKPRKRLQWFGTEGGRQQIKDTIWIDILLEKVKRDADKHQFVIDDVRFENELNALNSVGFYCIKLEIDEKTQRKRLFSLYGDIDETILSHPSEIGIEKLNGNIVIDATQCLEFMLKDVDAILKGGC